MSLLTEIFAGDDEDARHFSVEPESSERLDRLELKSLTDLEFSTLWAILEGEPWDVERHVLEKVYGSSEGPWMFLFPAGFVKKLHTLTPSEITAAAAQWAETEELSATSEETSSIVEQLAARAQSAAGNGKDLFLWFSL